MNGRKVRKGLGVRNWDIGQKMIRDMEAVPLASIPTDEAWVKFEEDSRMRGLSPDTMHKYVLLGRLVTARFGRTIVGAITVDQMTEFRNSWKLGGNAAQIRIALLRRFFKVCINRGWCEKNPASFLEAPKFVRTQVQPFTDQEMGKIMEALTRYPDRPPGRRAEVRAFVLCLRYTGLRIRDVVLFGAEKIQGDEISVVTHKTGAVVRLPAHQDLVDALKGLPKSPFFWSGQGSKKSAVAAWERTLKTLFKLAGFHGTAHQFRHTLASKLLTSGVSVDNVARILGNSSRIVERHYASWIPARQDALNEAVRATF